MKSIRLYLLLTLIATLTLVNFASLLQGYQASMTRSEKLFDGRLKSMAKIIASINRDQAENSSFAAEQTAYVYFQIWNDRGHLITRSNNAPTTTLSSLHEGFSDVNFARYRWRNYIYHDQASQRWIVTGERSDIRYILAEQVVLEFILPLVLSLPLAALFIWWLVGKGLRPLNVLAKQLSNKQADDLSPIELNDTPKELSQLVYTTNKLFTRLDDAFQREHRFSADAAHELRTPISILKVHSHNLQATLGRKNEDLKLLDQGIERMGNLVEQILALYRTSPDQIVAKLTRIDLYSLTQHIIARDYEQFESKEQTIELSGELSVFMGHTFAVETLIQNLLTNASKYTPDQGQVLVHIETISTGVRLIVEDSGPGIPSAQYERVFERFYRVNGDQHDSGTVGCGLGLAIIKHIVDVHQATILLAHSRFNSGLKVTIDFPKESTP